MECRVLNQQSKRLFTMTRRKGRWRFITTFFFFLSVETPDTLGGGGLTAVYWRCVLTCLVPPFFRQLNMRAEMLGR
jgi:hypothetical protein